MFQLRPYQEKARQAVWREWNDGIRSTLLVQPTGTGKTITFSSIIEDVVRAGGRCLVLAHREELLQQAADKLAKTTGLGCGLEKAESTAHDGWHNVVIGSVQTMQRLERRDKHEFTHIVVDEAHHALAPSYRSVLDHYPDAKILGVTATADRGDKRNLGEVFETVACEYSLPAAIRDGWLCRIKALTLPLKIDLAGVKTTAGDFQAADLGDKLGPYLAQISEEVRIHCADRKTVVFLPLVSTSQRFRDLLLAKGIDAREVNGDSRDRAETLAWFQAAPKGAVLCNAMLVTEGYDQSDIDCVCILRPTQVRSLYAQMGGRGTRLHPGKDHLLLLDFLWLSERHELCRPAHLVCQNPDLSKRVGEILAEDAQAEAVDLLDEQAAAESTATAEREEALAKLLAEQKHRKRALVDPLQYEYSVGQTEYRPDDRDLRAMGPPSPAQLKRLEDAGIFPDEVQSQGHASKLIDTLGKRRLEGLTTPKQIRCLERYGFQAVGTWQFTEAKKLIDRIAGNCWQVPAYLGRPKDYRPSSTLQEAQW